MPADHEMVAQSPADDVHDVNDPLEPLNRVILDFNEFIYGLILRPIAGMYVLVVPEIVRDAVHNALQNVNGPFILIQDLLQGEPERAWDTTRRFVINSTIGVGGLIDVADRMGIEGHHEDLGQTFAVWGVPEGFYLVVPVFGPSNPRDAVGKFLNLFLDPMIYWARSGNFEELTDTRVFLGGVNEFSQVMDDLQRLKDTSVDYYAALRSVSRQQRAAEINNGVPQENTPLPDLKYDFNTEFSQ